MGRSTVHYADNETNNILKRLHNKLRPAGTPVERVEYIIELLLLRIFEAKIKQDAVFAPLRKLFEGENYRLLFSHLLSLNGDQVLSELNKNIFPFYSSIISKARNVVSGNLPQKMQDQLVLMEEVFANSNFTNNVKGGVIAEVIGLVNEIDEKWILKTDLLGDAIESALSETGGTKDLGLYRTPDHIRKMMVEMVDPDFTDTIFDPACGTAGFLFNAYEYVIEKARRTRQFPAENIANQFYRTGLGGIEYQGRIRKMAAVNMYIRGLNPHNIEQGDSLKIFDPNHDTQSKSVVISNPPFGAERDQPAYPNIWEEFSKESETTILFVKLMFDLLKKSGRCAVVVSEGFLSWGQTSACSLRKLLINEANLRAIISLPQGVFVSKGGQGAKTSILYFEKGQPTNFVWYYKVVNDGFSMGTNRKEISGSQIPELLKLFKEVKQGKRPQNTKYSFCISKEQIETLDPRIAERIRQEVKEKAEGKNAKKREALIADLDKKFSEGRLSKELYDEKLWQFDNIVDGQIDNEIAKAIEKAHSYHFNLQNYRSSLNTEQIEAWYKALSGVVAENGSTIEKKYKELKKADSKTAVAILASFNPQNALQMDIARGYLSKLDSGLLGKHDVLKKLDEILRKGFQYPIVALKDLIVLNDEKIKPSEFINTEFIILGVSNQKGVFINEKQYGSEIKQTYFKVYKNQFCYNPYRINVGSIGLCEFDFVDQIISGAYNVFGCNESELNPKYLDVLIHSKKFLDYVNEKASGGVRMNFKVEYFQDWQIPLPPIEIQNTIVEKVEKQRQIINGAISIENGWQIETEIEDYYKAEKVELGSLIIESMYGTSSKADYQEVGYPVIRIGNIGFCKFDLSDIKNVELTEKEFNKWHLSNGDFLIVRSNGNPDLVGKCAVWGMDDGNYVYASYLIRFIFDSSKVLPKYVMYYLMSSEGRSLLKPKQGGGTNNINSEEFKKVVLPLYPLEIQRQIVEKLDRQMQSLEGVRLLKAEAQKNINGILAEIWGE